MTDLPHILLIDDDRGACAGMAEAIAGARCTVSTVHTLREARRQMQQRPPALVLLQPRLADGSGLTLFDEPGVGGRVPVALITDHGDVESCVQAMRLGASDYLVKPVDATQVRALLARIGRGRADAAAAAGPKPAHAPAAHGVARLLGRSAAMRQVREQVLRVAPTGVTVLVTGESGSGKELAASVLHELSPRHARPFLAINCGAISAHLMESEIFGHEKGSFTGAERQHIGFFERASGGTLFLDEITEMPPELQVKLLRVLETGTFMRVGATQVQHTDVRLVAATNRDPLQAVADGRLRDDLHYRLNVFPIHLPPLRERAEDVPQLARHFLREISCREGAHRHFAASALKELGAYAWPGNARELRNVVHRAYVMAAGEEITDPCLPRGDGPRFDACADTGELSLRVSLGTSWFDIQRQVTLATLEHFDGHHQKTSRALGVSVKTLYNWLRHWQAQPPAAMRRERRLVQ